MRIASESEVSVLRCLSRFTSSSSLSVVTKIKSASGASLRTVSAPCTSKRILEQFILLDHARKLFLRNEKIIPAVHFIRTLRARRGRDHKMERQAAFLHALNDGIFPRTGRAGDDDQQR